MSENMTCIQDMAEKLIDLGITYDVACKLTASAVHYDYKEGAKIYALVAQKLLQKGKHNNIVKVGDKTKILENGEEIGSQG